jgi:beta-lactamase superfamily II metal-dependent hydrolase
MKAGEASMRAMRAAVISLLSIVLFGLLGCEPGGSVSREEPTTPASAQATTVNEPTMVDEITVRDASQPPLTTTQAPARSTAVAEEPSSGNTLTITFLNVGQGSSALIQLPNGGNVLIDGGPREGGPERVADLQRLGAEQLDAVVISHADEDHAGGLIDVINSMPVSAVYDSGYLHTTQTYADLLGAVETSGARYVETRAG